MKVEITTSIHFLNVLQRPWELLINAGDDWFLLIYISHICVYLSKPNLTTLKYSHEVPFRSMKYVLTKEHSLDFKI
jgi:hypothetical protein